MSKVQMQIPQYKCHKKVWALKIKKIVCNPNKSVDLFFEEDGFLPKNIEGKEALRFTDIGGDLGYYVQYEDGYASWSPSKVFEDGYTLIEK